MSKNDTVNRKQAIDAFYPIRCKLQMIDDTQTADKMLHGLWLAEKAIKALPSAQPEIVRCKDCKHKPSGDGVNHRITFPDERCPCQCDDSWYSWLPDDDWFCGNAERREE